MQKIAEPKSRTILSLRGTFAATPAQRSRFCDLLVVAGVLVTMTPADLDQLERGYRGLSAELRHQVRSNLSILSLLDARPGMPDPRRQRPTVDALLRRLEAGA